MRGHAGGVYPRHVPPPGRFGSARTAARLAAPTSRRPHCCSWSTCGPRLPGALVIGFATLGRCASPGGSDLTGGSPTLGDTGSGSPTGSSASRWLVSNGCWWGCVGRWDGCCGPQPSSGEGGRVDWMKSTGPSWRHRAPSSSAGQGSRGLLTPAVTRLRGRTSNQEQTPWQERPDGPG